MWEQLIVYKQLEKTEINPTFKKLGEEMVMQLQGYKLEQTSTIIKLYRVVNHFEQAVFIEKSRGGYDLEVSSAIKPVDFYLKHKFNRLNIVPLGTIMGNYKKSFYPLTKEWMELAQYLASRIQNEIEIYFERLNTYEKIIYKRLELEEFTDKNWNNGYYLLAYAALRTRNPHLLKYYFNKQFDLPMNITLSEYLKGYKLNFDLGQFSLRLKALADKGDFDTIENELASLK
jgi:hypothetical protein